MAAQLPNYTSHPGRYLSLEHRTDPGNCQIFQFDERETEVMRRILAVIPKYYWVWGLDGPVNTWDVGQIELWDTISSVIEELEEKLIMGCDTNSIIAALNNIATSGGGGGSCYCDIPADTVIPAEPAEPSDMAGHVVPDGYTGTWAQYQDYKCKAANKITDDLIATLYGMATISGLVTGMSAGLAYMVILAVMTGSGPSLLASGILGIMGLGIASPYVIAGIVVACVALFAFGGAGLGYLASVADAITADKEDFVCALYNSDSVSEAQTDILALLDSYYDVGWTEPLRDLLDTITISLLATATLNVLFVENSDVAAYTTGTIDCDGCPSGCDIYYMYFGTEIGSFDFTSTQHPTNGWQYIKVSFNHDGTGYCGGPVTIASLTKHDDTTNPVGKTVLYRLYNQAGSILYYDHDVSPTNITLVGRMEISIESTTNPNYYAGDFSIQANF